MSKSLNELWKNPCDLHRKLKEFEASFDDEMLDGRFDKLMPVEDKYGNKPIVLALSEEPLHLLVDRVRAVGGNANVFVREGNHIISISAKDDSNPSVASENWADENDWESGSSPISLFIHALKQHPNGIQIPSTLPAPASDSATTLLRSIGEETPASSTRDKELV
ncbi:hypothetical protein [Bifidobacterium animalis]|uniref:hypothetical protein n=1 Tax=Bifidobacterium animalis TaxID=28025 RepID=UPI00080C63F2|nr:hypothetical protein [Bifidobacterium animalis]ANU43125.1 hypothetical protein A4U98_00485 [Bifidobacterium animalis subsp. animalis]PHQ53729.1 hypothetical protein ADH71_005740 [Bifidobacterium animalis subsp. animalis]QQQ90776.1 hypothetical protein I5Q88_02850 [Bifidobacterium animalis]UQE62727.1 hypothetical protein M2855_04790 [Bifidobacterium animalis]